jgi:hypothetical protein
LVNDRQKLRSLVVGWGFIPCFEKGGWRCIRFGHVRKWLSNPAVKRGEVWVSGVVFEGYRHQLRLIANASRSPINGS